MHVNWDGGRRAAPCEIQQRLPLAAPCGIPWRAMLALVDSPAKITTKRRQNSCDSDIYIRTIEAAGELMGSWLLLVAGTCREGLKAQACPADGRARSQLLKRYSTG